MTTGIAGVPITTAFSITAEPVPICTAEARAE
jgi:hypothetical protein